MGATSISSMEKPLKPKLRFKIFNEDLTNIKLGEIAKFSKGKGISKNDISVDGKFECIRYGELYTQYGETIENIKSKTNLNIQELVLSEENDVIIPASGETPIDIATASCVTRAGVALGGDLNIIKTENSGVFLSYYLNSKKRIAIANLAQGNSVVHLYSKQLALLDLNLPSKLEQKKIASFLSSVDQKIQQLTCKKEMLEQYKKGVMQQLFSGKLRFKDENGKAFPKWEEKRLGNIADIKRGGSPRPITDPKWFDPKSKIGWVRISDVTKSYKYLNETTQYLSKDGIEKSRLVKEGSMIMSICATIGKPIYTKFEVCIHDGFVVFENLEADKEFLYYYLDKIQLNWYKYGQPGSQVNLNIDIVSNESMPYPSMSEQIKIANFLSKIDNKIDIVKNQITQTQTFKKGLLQEIFI